MSGVNNYLHETNSPALARRSSVDLPASMPSYTWVKKVYIWGLSTIGNYKDKDKDKYMDKETSNNKDKDED